MSLKIIFYPPIDRIAGSIKELDISHSVSVADVLRLLEEQVPGIEPYVRFENRDKHAQGLLVWRCRNLLTLDDMLAPTDEIEMVPMVAGG